jgi:hypothetical protein
MELCAGGELFDSIVEAGNFTEKKAALYFRKMVEVVNHCHELGVMHRDLKPGRSPPWPDADGARRSCRSGLCLLLCLRPAARGWSCAAGSARGAAGRRREEQPKRGGRRQPGAAQLQASATLSVPRGLTAAAALATIAPRRELPADQQGPGGRAQAHGLWAGRVLQARGDVPRPGGLPLLRGARGAAQELQPPGAGQQYKWIARSLERRGRRVAHAAECLQRPGARQQRQKAAQLSAVWTTQ